MREHACALMLRGGVHEPSARHCGLLQFTRVVISEGRAVEHGTATITNTHTRTLVLVCMHAWGQA
eukprot:1709506-Alexandrium_andersonii.AAC.1